jgi:hypothetical protein
VQVIAPATLIGEVVPVTIVEIGTNSLFGTLAVPAVDASRSSVNRDEIRMPLGTLRPDEGDPVIPVEA